MLKIIGFGLLNFLGRFIVGGVLYQVIKLNPEGFWYGLLLTITAFGLAYVLLKFVMKPTTPNEAFKTVLIWVVIALVLDVVTAKPIVHIPVSYLFSEFQTWTRLAAIVLAVPFAIRRNEITKPM